MAESLVALANITLGSSVSTVSFTSIASYRTLRLVVSGTSGVYDNQPGPYIRFNGNTSSVYNAVNMYAWSTQKGGFVGNSNKFESSTFPQWKTATPSNYVMNILNADSSYTATIGRTNTPDGVETIFGNYQSGGPITSIQVYFDSGSGNVFGSGTTMALYGIAAV